MLILSRTVGEAIIIDGVSVRVMEVRGQRVSLGVIAPKEVEVDREEVWQNKQRERKEQGDAG